MAATKKKEAVISKIRKFKKKDLPKLNYGIIHAQFGYADGVSIVMKQIDSVMIETMKIPKNNIYYLVGRSKTRWKNVTVRKDLFFREKTNSLMIRRFEKGYGGDYNEKIEKQIAKVQNLIEEWIEKTKVDVIIAHNTSHPINFVLSVALHRYYRNAVREERKTPKYLLWWHDSHIERRHFQNPSSDVKQYLLQGVPGRFVEYIMFINSLQFKDATKYFLELDQLNPGYFDAMHENHTVMYNTADTFIDSYDDLESDKMSDRIEKFLEDFKVRDLLKEKRLTLSQVLFCLQHTRILERKRIDFALRYAFEILKRKRATGTHTKALYFLVSGHRADNSKTKLKILHKKLCKEYNLKNLFLVFAEDYNTDIKFEEYPIIIAKLRGFATYFSEIEGFGNNLLEIMASGLIPLIYTYPVFVKDIAKYKFKCIALDKFEIFPKDIDNTLDILRNDRKRKMWVNHNLEVLRRRFGHKMIALKLKRAIIRKRLHK